jgi:transposase
MIWNWINYELSYPCWIRFMFHLHNSLRYFLYPLPVDMRKSFYTLSGIVSYTMNRNVRDGEVFIFMNRNRNVMKILHIEYAGMVIYYKKLESGRFKLPEYDQNTTSIAIDWKDLITMVESVRIRSGKLHRNVNKTQNNRRLT